MLNGTPDALMLCFARLIRCAIVASGTRNALAISAVVSPPTARSVSAIADAGDERRMTAHEQQDQRVVLIGDRRRAAPSVDARSANCSAEARPGSSDGELLRDNGFAPPARQLAADVIGHAPRAPPGSASRADCPARPSRGHCAAAAMSASCTASSDAAKSRNRRITAPSTCGASSRSRCSASASSDGHQSLSSSGGRAHHLADFDRHVAAARRRGPARPTPRRDLVRALRAFDVDDPVAGEELLRLRKHAVGDRLAVLAGADDAWPGRARPAPRPPTSSPDCAQLLGEALS